MFGISTNHDSIRKAVIYFGRLFNNIILTKNDGSRSKVPLGYGNREKFLSRAEGNPDLQRQIAAQLPRMSFEIIDFKYAPERKLSTMGRISSVSSNNSVSYQYSPVPYDIMFNLYIMVKNQDDGCKIVENILPFFTPEFTASLDLNPDIGQKFDVPLVLNSVSHEDTYEGSYENRRTIIWTLSFTMNFWMFGPTNTGKIIKEIDVNFRIPPQTVEGATSNNSPVVANIHIEPGLTANGEPTSSANNSISNSLINSDDNYGFIIDYLENY